MSYTFDTVQFDNTDNALDFYNLIATELTAHASWTFVETVSNRYIWENDGTLNSWGEDFYVAFYPTGNTLYILASEGYDAGANNMFNPCYNPNTSATPNADAGYGTLAVDNYNAYIGLSMVLTGSGFYDYVIGVSADHIVLANTASDFPIDVGLFESLFPSAPNEFPLMRSAPMDFDNDDSGSFSRVPGLEGASTTDCFAKNNAEAAMMFTPVGGQVGAGFEHYGGVGNPQPIGSRLLARHTAGGAEVRGLHYDLLFVDGSGIQMGDTLTIDGDLYAYLSYGAWLNTTI